jgi:hypothetical protein
MSLGYSIAATLQENFLENTIKNILEKGASLGFVYYRYLLGNLNIGDIPLNVDDALIAIYEGYKEADMYCITIAVEKTYFNLNFIEDNNKLIVMLPSLNALWSRKYKNNEFDIDIERYVKIFLGLVHDYKILDMHVEYD